MLQALEEDEPRTPRTPQQFVVAGGLGGLNVAHDLLNLDFSAPEDAPDEFRNVQYDSQRITTLRSGLSGTHLRCPLPLSTASHFEVEPTVNAAPV